MMKNNILKFIIFALIFSLFPAASVFAEDEPATPAIYPEVSPVSQRLSLDPGASGTYEIKVKNLGSEEFSFRVYAAPYSVSNEDYDLSFSTETTRTQISRWITFEQEEYVAPVGETTAFKYTVSVPEDVPAGSQYAVVFVELIPGASDSGEGGIKTISRIAVVIYGSVSGETREESEIAEVKLTGFLVSGDITASALVKNSGNTDFPASSSLKVSSLFGKVLHEQTESRDVLPDTERRVSLVWEDTPSLGIFRGEYTISASGSESVTKNRLIFIIPIFILIPAILLLTSIIVLAILYLRKRRLKRINAKI
jgi:hypothetical protein